MREVNLAGIDLNLLPALEALLRRRSVTRAAEDVGLSQPAMSRALARLRDTLGDPLLVRVPGGLAPTPRALALAPRLAGALDALGGVYRDPKFDPALMRRVFRIAGADPQTVLIAPLLLRKVLALAPGVGLRFEAYSEDMRARIDGGALDLAFAVASTPLPPGAFSESVGMDRLALVMRRGHPLAGRSWTIADYGRVDHVTISIFGGEGSEIDTRLAEAGVARRIVSRTPHFTGALASVGATDCVSTLSRALAKRFADNFGLVLMDPPFADLSVPLIMVGAVTRAADPALVWLRGLIREAAAEVFAD